jgi:hypothetical protein
MRYDKRAAPGAPSSEVLFANELPFRQTSFDDFSERRPSPHGRLYDGSPRPRDRHHNFHNCRRRSSPAHRPVSIISFANKSCQSRFAPNNERLALQIDERRRDKRQGARSLMSKQQPLRRNYG